MRMTILHDESILPEEDFTANGTFNDSMMYYRIPFKNESERKRITKWVGITPGVTLMKRDECWRRTYDEPPQFFWITSYILEVKNKKAELALKLKFPESYKKGVPSKQLKLSL